MSLRRLAKSTFRITPSIASHLTAPIENYPFVDENGRFWGVLRLLQAQANYVLSLFVTMSEF